MKKLSFALLWAMLVVFWGVVPIESALGGTYSGGTGTETDPYLISTAEDMQAIGANPGDWGKHFLLTADVDLSAYTGTQFNIIGYYGASNNDPFTGVFDGNGHTISNFTYTISDNYEIGIFGYVKGANALVKDLHLSNPTVNTEYDYGSAAVGSLVGRLDKGRITGCSVTGGRISRGPAVQYGVPTGGLAGCNYGGRISNCHAATSVAGWGFSGGLVGYLSSGIISHCYAAGSVAGKNDCSGGLAGRNYQGTISNCYATGSVVTTAPIVGLSGGLVGINDYGTISNCYATGSVTGIYSAAGLVAYNDCGTISNCYATGSVTKAYFYTGGLVAKNDSGGIVNTSFWDMETTDRSTSAGGVGKTTVEMQTMSTFTDAGWDFLAETANGIEDIWRLCQDGTDYPKLAWQMIMLGDFVCGDGVRFNDLDIFMKQWLLEKLSADVSPARGDGMVDFADWAVFANTLQNTVDLNDVAVFAGQWLRLGAYCADIAPSPGGDGVVDTLDFAVLAEHWLGDTG